MDDWQRTKKNGKWWRFDMRSGALQVKTKSGWKAATDRQKTTFLMLGWG